MKTIQSELLKYKRTYTRKIAILAPLFFTVYALIIQALLPRLQLSESHSWMWQSLLALIFNWWSFIILPLGIALFSTLVAMQEKKAGSYRTLRVHNVSAMTIWINKIMVMAIHTLFSTFVLVIAIALVGIIARLGDIPFKKIISASFLCWTVSLVLIPIQLWLATWRGIFLSMGVGFFGMVIGVLTAPKRYWFIVPWSWTTRLMCPIIGIHPNGIILEPGNPLLNPAVISIGVTISLTAFILITLLTAFWFNMREEKC